MEQGIAGLLANPIDLICLITSTFLLWLYQQMVKIRTRRDPHYSLFGMSNEARKEWLVMLAKRGGDDILAVQTLRNSTMAATFLASTAVLLIIGTLSFGAQAGHNGSISLFGIRYGLTPGLLLVKVMVIVLLLISAFFCFTTAIRIFNHLGYVLAAFRDPEKVPTALPRATMLINRAGGYYSLGMRCYYFLIPYVFWLFGAGYLLAATLGVMAVLYRIDRAPALQHDLTD
ncbi:DUF599 domain-containing protein [Chitinivorax sp. B]|uniref:DUF599 domain-containing protein n=1 Tax=Chitinivorax sp. B TaxID=2502235 RepID=UPI0010F89768|nr:DUF599 domain-containing protein [Chitinivorax sp. B]